MSEKFLAEEKAIKIVTGPVDLNTGANTGGRVSMVNARRVSFLLLLAAGTSTSAHTLTLKQHDAATAGNSYDLTSDNPYYYKLGAATVFTRVNPGSAVAATDLHSVLADQTGIVIFEVLSEQLRSDCKWVSLDITDAGGAQLGTCLAFVETEVGPAYAQAV